MIQFYQNDTQILLDYETILTTEPLMNVIIDHFTEAETKKEGRS